MSVEIYVHCSIEVRQFKDAQSIRFYPQCLIELRQYDLGQYRLHGIDQRHRLKIFEIPLRNRQQYQFGSSLKDFDSIEFESEIYRIQIEEKSRNSFHRILRTCLEEFLILDEKFETLSKSKRSNELIQDLVQLDDQPFYRNFESFQCLTCFEFIEINSGILFHHCLHPLCKNCLLQMIKTSTESMVRCPHDNCSMIIDEREMRGVIRDLNEDEKLLDHLLESGLRVVEGQNKTVHCLTPDCPRWWFISSDEENSLIHCDGCKHWICLSCKAIHEGQTCKEYSDELLEKQKKIKDIQDDEKQIQEMIERREIMYCPGCRILIQKSVGCDWIQCFQCKIEICWATLGPRWGPNGHGDISGGCRCRVDNGKLCVPNCGNCH